MRVGGSRLGRGQRDNGKGHRWQEVASMAGPGAWEGGQGGRNEGEAQSGGWGDGGRAWFPLAPLFPA